MGTAMALGFMFMVFVDWLGQHEHHHPKSGDLEHAQEHAEVEAKVSVHLCPSHFSH